MSSVYLINVGANTSHGARARGPLFENGSFIWVPFPTSKPKGPPGYSEKALPFLHNVEPLCTHADPDWINLTYGDDCSNRRAMSLRNVSKGDVLLFWGLLWQNNGKDWNGFTGEKGWYLLGALRVEEIGEEGESVRQLANRDRASKNAHFARGGGILRTGKRERVFVGETRYSKLFPRAVDLEVKSRDGLLYRAFTSADGKLLKIYGTPSWRSSLRSCRKMWDLNDHVQRKRAEIVRDVILKRTDYDLLRNL